MSQKEGYFSPSIDSNNELLLKEFLAASLDLLHADMGNIQLVDENDGCMKMVTHHGFNQPFLDFFKVITASSSTSCAVAEKRKKRVIVDDITKSSIYVGTPALTVMLEAGVRAVQSTPFITRSGIVIGVISTHYSERFVPNDSDLQRFDLLVGQTTDRIEQLGLGSLFSQSEQENTNRQDTTRETVERELDIDPAQNGENEDPPSNRLFASAADSLKRPVYRTDENELDKNLLERRAQNLSTEELDREIAELSNDLDFLESQVQADLKSYSLEELAVAKEKIARVRRELEFFNTELAKRG